MGLIRFFDLVFSLVGLIILSPFLLIIAVIIRFDGHGRSIYLQQRVGMNGRVFKLIKFRSMKPNSDKELQLTIGNSDNRITPMGRFLRRYKLDELPQLFNVLIGEMSIVGPRPEVKKYVDLYTDYQKQVLRVRPGITDYASIEYIDENDILAISDNPEKDYLEVILPRKLELSLKYAQKPNISSYFTILFKTLHAIFIR